MFNDFLVGANIRMQGMLLDATLDVQEMLTADGASDALSGVNTFVDNFGSSGFSLAQKLGVYAVGIGIATAGIVLAISGGNSTKVAEVKASALPKFIGGLLIFGAIAGVVLLQSVGANLFSLS